MGNCKSCTREGATRIMDRNCDTNGTTMKKQQPPKGVNTQPDDSFDEVHQARVRSSKTTKFGRFKKLRKTQLQKSPQPKPSSQNEGYTEGPHLGSAVRFRDNKDNWQTGEIVSSTNIIGSYRVIRHWLNGMQSNVPSDVQCLSKRDVEELEEHICSEFDRLFGSRNLEVFIFEHILLGPLYGGGDKSLITVKSTGDSCRECAYPFSDGMLKRVGASLRRHCRDLKRCEIQRGFFRTTFDESWNRFSRDASTALLRGIASAFSPTVTTLRLSWPFMGESWMEEELPEYVLETLVSERRHMLRELELHECIISSLGFLQKLAQSLRVFGLWDCTLRDLCCLNDLDEFFETQTRLEDSALCCLKVDSHGPLLIQTLDCLRRHDFLKTLHLHGDGFNTDDALQVQQFLQATKVLQELHLPYFLEDATCQTISEGLARCPSLEELTFSPASKVQMKTIFSALVHEQQTKDSQQGLRVLTFQPGPEGSFLNTPDDIQFLLEQLERLPALRHIHLGQHASSGLFSAENSVGEKLLLNALEGRLMLETLEGVGCSRLETTVNSLCRVNKMLNCHIRNLLDAPKAVPLYLWPMILASVSPKVTGLFHLLRSYPPKLADTSRAGGL